MTPENTPIAERQSNLEPAGLDSNRAAVAPPVPPSLSDVVPPSAAPCESSPSDGEAHPMEFPYAYWGSNNPLAKALEGLLGLCPEFLPSVRWQHCCTHADLVTTSAYITPPCTTTLAAQLLETCSQNDLLAAHVLVSIDDVLQLNPKLSTPNTPIIGLLDKNTWLLYDLLTPSGLLSGDGLPAIAALNDLITVRASESTDAPLFLAFTIETVILLRAIGLPATLALGIDAITPNNLEQLCECFGFKRTLSAREQELLYAQQMRSASSISMADEAQQKPFFDNDVECPQLALVAWDLYNLSRDEPEGFRNVAATFKWFEDCLDIDTFEANVWQIKKEDFDKLGFVVQRTERAWTQPLLLDSAFDGTHYLFLRDRASQAESQVRTFAEAAAQLQRISPECSIDSKGRERWNAAVQDYSRTMMDDLIKPLMPDVERTVNPVQRNTKAVFAQLSGLIHMKMPLIFEENMALLCNAAGRNDSGQHVKELMALTNQLLALARNL